MKKKIIVTLLTLGLAFSCGCTRGEKIKTSDGIEVAKIGPYVEISHEEGFTPSGDKKVMFYSCYNRETRIMFLITCSPTRGNYDYCLTINYDYDYDEEGRPILKFYKGDK